MKTLVKIGLALLIVLVLLAGGGAFYLISNINAIIAGYKPELERRASESLGSTVTLGEISASVFPRTSMVVETVKVVDESHPDESLTLGNVKLHLELIPLLSKRVVINELAVADPTIRLIVAENGIFVSGLPRDGGAEPSGDTSSGDGGGSGGGEATPLEVQLQHLAFKNVTLTIVDTIADEEYVVTDMDIASAVSMDKRRAEFTDLDVAGNALDGIDFAFSGASVAYDLSRGAVSVSEMDGEFLGNKMAVEGGLDPKDAEEQLVFREESTDLASLGPVYDAFAPGLHDLALGGNVSAVLRVWLRSDSSFQAEGAVDLEGVEATVGEFVLAGLTGSMELEIRPNKQVASAEKLTGTLNDAPVDIQMELRASRDRARIDPLRMTAFSGEANLLTTLNMDGSDTFKSELTITEMRVEEMIPALAPDLKDSGLSGLLESARGGVKGVLDESMTESLNGRAEFKFVEGLLEGVNVAKESLGELGELPIVQGAMMQYVPERYHEAFASDRTVLNLVTGSFRIADEAAKTDDLHVESTYFTMDGSGVFGMDSSVDVDATIRFTPEFSSALAKSIRELEYIYDEDDRLTFPIHIEGVSPDLDITADLSELMKKGMENAVTNEVKQKVEDEVGEEIGNVLNDLLDGSSR